MRNWIDDITESNAYQAWEYSQYEPEEHLFIGRSRAPKLPKELPGWMTRGPLKEDDNWEEKEKRGEEFLKNRHE